MKNIGLNDLIALNTVKRVHAGNLEDFLKNPGPLKKGFDADKELELVKKHGIKLISFFDKDYPDNLKEIYDPPILLYVKGNITKKDKIAISIVGSRDASLYGLTTSERLAKELAGLGVTVVSGLARGIDSAAHKGALKAKGRTIAVLGNGLASIYPPENKKLAQMIAENGAVISEFPMETKPEGPNFPRRNRIISGLSLGTVVVEAAKRSGSLITGSLALEQGREVFAVPGNANRINSYGTNHLIRDGAKLVENAQDILEEVKVNCG